MKIGRKRDLTLEEVEKYRWQHQVRRPELVSYLAESIRERGWSGPPLVVRLDDTNDMDGPGVLDSGVHRVAALQRLQDECTGDKVPPLRIPTIYPRFLHLHISSSYDGRDWVNSQVAPYTRESISNLFAANAICLRAMDRNVKGDYVSCRSATDGAVAAVMCYTMRYCSANKSRQRRIRIVGSFTEDRVRARLSAWGAHLQHVACHQGRFQNRVPNFARGPIAFLFLDTDSYRQTSIVLDALYPHLSLDGWIYVASWGRPGVAEAVESYLGGLPDADIWSGVKGPLFWQRGRDGGAFWTGERDTLRIYMTTERLNDYVLDARVVSV